MRGKKETSKLEVKVWLERLKTENQKLGNGKWGGDGALRVGHGKRKRQKNCKQKLETAKRKREGGQVGKGR